MKSPTMVGLCSGYGVKVRVITYDGGIVFGEWC